MDENVGRGLISSTVFYAPESLEHMAKRKQTGPWQAYFDADYCEESRAQVATGMVLTRNGSPVFKEACSDPCGAEMELLERVAIALNAEVDGIHRITEALKKHHPGWIDGNGSAVDKVVKFIEEAK